MKLSLRSLIAIPLIGQIVVVTALTGWLTYRNNQAAIQELAYQILDEAGRHLDHQLTDYTKIPTLITQENLDTLKLQNLNSDELERWLPYLYRQIQRFADITYIYYGNTDGQYVEISRLANGDLELALIDGTSDKSEVPNQPVKIYPINDDGQITKAELERSYDPRERPWYKAGLNNQIAGWTDVYDFNDPSPTFGLSFIRPYTSINDQIQGVLGADFTLRDLETFLIHNQPSRSSISFIMDASGKILASSEGTSSFRKSRGSSATTLSERDKKDNVVVSTAINQILRDFSDRKQPNYDQQFRFRINQEHYWGQLTPFSDKYGLNWLGVSLIPESDFTQQLHANNRNTLLLCIIAMMASTGISLVIARFLSTPMERLGLATQAIAQNQTHQRLLPSSIHELNLLIDSFNRMGADLGESRAQLNTHSQQLETLINQRTEALRRSEETFAKAFQVSPNAITLSTVKEGRYIKVNDRFVDLMGLPREKIVGRTSVELGVWIPPQTREVFYQELSNGRLRNQEWKVQNALGEVKTILLSAEIIHF
ncbi:MAG: HAMP domain-containing protein, partial [Cyanobacteria bacterium P01_C01_bin.118]